MKSKHLDFILAFMLVAVVVSGFAATWTKTSAPDGPSSLGMSADGRIILGVPSTSLAVTSTNRGLTWAYNPDSPTYGNLNPRGIVAISADGTRIVAALATNAVYSSTTVCITTNYGALWTGTSVSSSNFARLVVACSGDATKLIAGIGNGPIRFSTNSGINWKTSSVPNAAWISVASSTDGQRMAAVVNGGRLYFSTDFGAAWAPTNLPALSWNSVCLSSDGKWAGVTSATNGTYISSSAGVSWITNQLNGNAIRCSADGTNWIIAGAQVYTSTDGGMTWITNLSAGDWTDAAVSADGCEFMVTGGGSGPYGIWVGHTTPSPQLNIQPTDGNMALSWLVPSTNFVLQQNSDLTTTNWVTVSNSPILNFTNLQDEVSIPASPSNGFFRLIAQ